MTSQATFIPTPPEATRTIGKVHADLVFALAALFAVVALQFPLIWQRSIHWDEFYHFAEVHQLANGTLTQPLQTLKSRLFVWVLEFPGNGIDHIIIIRFAMFAFELLAAVSIAAVAARFTDKVTGLICAAAYIGGGFVFQHGFSFRADPINAGLLMCSLWILLATKLRFREIVVGGFLLGLATMISIKVILFAPAFAGIAWLRWNEEGRSNAWLYRLVGLGCAAAFFFAIIYWLHANGMGGGTTQSSERVLNASANKMFSFGSVPYLIFAAKQMLLAPALAIFIICFPGAQLRSSFTVHERIALAGLFAPLLTLFFYHNTAPYFYVFMLPPVIAAASIAIAEFRVKFGTALVAGMCVLSTFLLWTRESSEPIRNQRILTEVAEKAFPGKVGYVDFCGFLGSFPKANPFMTPWAIELYKSGFYPSIKASLATATVPLMMDNDPMFTRLMTGSGPAPEFLPDDAQALRSNFVHFWGPYWIAGKEFGPQMQGERVEFLVPGYYTAHGEGLMLDGKRIASGAVINFQRGTYRISTGQESTKLIWGQNIKAPAQPAPTTPFWTPF